MPSPYFDHFLITSLFLLRHDLMNKQFRNDEPFVVLCTLDCLCDFLKQICYPSTVTVAAAYFLNNLNPFFAAPDAGTLISPVTALQLRATGFTSPLQLQAHTAPSC